MPSLAQLYTSGADSDLTGRFNTALSDDEEAAFQAWRARLPARLQSMSDYDLRGAWKSNAKAATNGHLPDTWKKPNHPTFSDESMYSGKDGAGVGGQWMGDGGDLWSFRASPANLRYRNASGLAQYFKEAEPNASVILPIDYSLPAKR